MLKREVEKWTNMPNFGWKMRFMNGNCFVVFDTTKFIVNLFEDEGLIKDLMDMLSSFVL
jgi:hypothetical protein